MADRTPLADIARLFLKLGTIAFGGPAAHIAMLEDEVVRRRRWLTREEFLDYLGATNLIPGPNSTEMAIHIGNARCGWRGLLVAGACFILPAALIVAALASLYVQYGKIPTVTAILYGIKPVVIAVVLQALWGLARTAAKSPWLAAVGMAAVVAVALGVNELVVLATAGIATGVVAAMARWSGAHRPVLALEPFSLWLLFGVFAKIGAVLFGSGYVLLAFLRADLVERLGWLTQQQLLDAIVVGQVTPGPVFTTATFVGFLLGGWTGAMVETIGIFLPAFIFVAVSGPLVPRIRRSPTAGAVLDGVNVASLALMAVVSWQLGRSAIIDLPTTVLAALSLLLLLRFRVNSFWLVTLGGLVGLLIPLL